MTVFDLTQKYHSPGLIAGESRWGRNLCSSSWGAPHPSPGPEPHFEELEVILILTRPWEECVLGPTGKRGDGRSAVTINHLDSQLVSVGAGGRTLTLSNIMSASDHLEDAELDLLSLLCMRQGRGLSLLGMYVRDARVPGDRGQVQCSTARD